MKSIVIISVASDLEKRLNNVLENISDNSGIVKFINQIQYGNSLIVTTVIYD